jgi:hypothetical protein
MAQGKGRSGARREPVFDSSPELRVETGDRPGGGKPPARKKRPRKARKARQKRSLIGRAVYWSLVLALWLVIGAVGDITAAELSGLIGQVFGGLSPGDQSGDDRAAIPEASPGDSGALVVRRTAVPQFARSQYVVNYKAEQAIHRGFLRTI